MTTQSVEACPQEALDMARERLIVRFENNFTCKQGERKAFFEIPQKDGDPVRVVYVTYAVGGLRLKDVVDWFVGNVIEPLIDKAQQTIEDAPEAGGPWLYWRIAEAIQVTFNRDNDGQYKIRTRLAILDNALDPIELEDEIKRQGELTHTCAYSAGAYK